MLSCLSRSATCHRSLGYIALAVIAVIGCSPQPYEGRTAKVSGNVSLGGAAVTTGNVLLMMEDGHAANCAIGSDGAYASECRPGKYKVAITPPELIDPLAGASGGAGRVSIPTRYQDLGTSGLTVELKAGDNTFDIAMNK